MEDARAGTAVPPPPGPIPFRAGETARYSVGWAGTGMNVEAGSISLAVEGEYRFVVRAETAPWVARFFEARELFATRTDALLLPQLHEREQHEGARHVTRAVVYDHASGVVRLGRTAEEAAAPEAVVLPLAPHARDAIAALFYARTLPLEPGMRYRIPVNEAGRSLVVDLAVAGRESIQIQGKTWPAIRLTPAIEQRVTRRRAVTAELWVSDDDRRIPLLVTVDAPFGAFRVELASYTGSGG
jgi:hypothetical protein